MSLEGSLNHAPQDGRGFEGMAVTWSDADAEALWQHCQNSVGIARLLLHEGRPLALVATACRSAVEYACRAALLAAGRPFPGDLAGALESLAAPSDFVWETLDEPGCAARLAATERVLAWASAHMRRAVPGRPWGY
jgi:hypothetical protein